MRVALEGMGTVRAMPAPASGPKLTTFTEQEPAWPICSEPVGPVALTLRSEPGGTGQGLSVEPLKRGLGAEIKKSRLLLSVSVQPSAARKPAVVVLRAGTATPSKQLAVPKPTRSMTAGSPMGQPERGSRPLTRATLKLVAVMTTSGATK